MRFDGRVRVHLLLFGIVIGMLLVTFAAGPAEAMIDRISIVSAWQFMVLLTIVLVIGPRRAIVSGRATLNSHLRRDLAIWAGVAGLIHLVAGTGESMNPVYIATFVAPAGDTTTLALRNELFTWGTIIGLAIGVLLLMPLALSSDRALRRIGARWWKRLQRSSYVVFALTVGHALAFQYLESRSLWLVAAMVCLVAIVVVAQVAGYRIVRRAEP